MESTDAVVGLVVQQSLVKPCGEALLASLMDEVADAGWVKRLAVGCGVRDGGVVVLHGCCGVCGSAENG